MSPKSYQQALQSIDKDTEKRCVIISTRASKVPVCCCIAKSTQQNEDKARNHEEADLRDAEQYEINHDPVAGQENVEIDHQASSRGIK